MLQNNNTYKLLKIFLDNPTDSFRLRELSRLAKISPPSVVIYLGEFEEQGLIKKYTKREIPFYQALRDNEKFIFYKKLSILYELDNSGLIDYLWEKLSPEAIILYGSYVKGESIENSDIDLFLVCKDNALELGKYEKKLGKKIHLMFQKDFNNVSKEFKNNIINGIVLKGYIKLF